MYLGHTNDGEERHLFEFDDGCTHVADGVDRVDAQGKANADHEDCVLHTDNCRSVNELMQETLAMTLHCNGECGLTEEQVLRSLEPPRTAPHSLAPACTELSVAGRRWQVAAEAAR